jgi:hypothetical protein
LVGVGVVKFWTTYHYGFIRDVFFLKVFYNYRGAVGADHKVGAFQELRSWVHKSELHWPLIYGVDFLWAFQSDRTVRALTYAGAEAVA